MPAHRKATQEALPRRFMFAFEFHSHRCYPARRVPFNWIPGAIVMPKAISRGYWAEELDRKQLLALSPPVRGNICGIADSDNTGAVCLSR